MYDLYDAMGQVAEIRFHLEALGRSRRNEMERRNIETVYVLCDYVFDKDVLSYGEGLPVHVEEGNRRMSLESRVDRILKLTEKIGKRGNEGIRQCIVSVMGHFVKSILLEPVGPKERENPSFDVSFSEAVRIISKERDPFLFGKKWYRVAQNIANRLRKDEVLMGMTNRYQTSENRRYVHPDRFDEFRRRVYELLDGTENSYSGVSPRKVIEQVVLEVFGYDPEREPEVVGAEVRSFVRNFGKRRGVSGYIGRKPLIGARIPEFKRVVRGLLEGEVVKA
jgi:hypothetical protein